MKNVIEKLFSGIFDCLVYLFCCLIEFLSTRPLLTCKFLLLSPFHKYKDYFLYIELIGNKLYFTSIIRSFAVTHSHADGTHLKGLYSS